MRRERVRAGFRDPARGKATLASEEKNLGSVYGARVRAYPRSAQPAKDATMSACPAADHGAGSTAPKLSPSDLAGSNDR